MTRLNAVDLLTQQSKVWNGVCSQGCIVQVVVEDIKSNTSTTKSQDDWYEDACRRDWSTADIEEVQPAADVEQGEGYDNDDKRF